MMASQWDDFKDEIIGLYLNQDLPLNKVIEVISSRHGFVKRPRAYREKLKSWNALKTQNQFRDSGYASNRASASAATTPSRPVSTDDMSQGTPLSVSDPMDDIVQHASPSDAASLQTLESDGSNATVRNPFFTEEQIHTYNTQQGCSLIQGLNDLHGGHTNPTRAGLENIPHENHTQPQPVHSTPTQFQPLSVTSASIHAPMSRCSRAHDEQCRIRIDTDACGECGASKAHYLALIANTIRKQALFERLYSDISNINTLDTSQNAPLHFLASSGPEPDRIQIFERAGANIFSKNVHGDTFLHVLEPSKLRGPYLLDLLAWCIRKGFDLKQRNYNGRTVLHCLMHRDLSADDWMSVLTALQSATKRFIARDNTHSPLADYLLARDNQGHTSIQAKADSSSLQAVIDYFLPKSELRHCTGYASVSLVPGHNYRPQSRDWLTTDELQELQEKDRIMRSTVSRSAEDPSATNPGDGMNALSCLAHIVRFHPELEMDSQPIFARETDIKKCFKSGVDFNHYDCSGSPPLHHFLSTFRNNESDEKTADLIALLVLYGADVNMRNAKGESPLHVACQLGRVSCVKKLIMFKANVHALDYQWNGILVSARSWKDVDPANGARIQECIDLVCRAATTQCR